MVVEGVRLAGHNTRPLQKELLLGWKNVIFIKVFATLKKVSEALIGVWIFPYSDKISTVIQRQ